MFLEIGTPPPCFHLLWLEEDAGEALEVGEPQVGGAQVPAALPATRSTLLGVAQWWKPTSPLSEPSHRWGSTCYHSIGSPRWANTLGSGRIWVWIQAVWLDSPPCLNPLTYFFIWKMGLIVTTCLSRFQSWCPEVSRGRLNSMQCLRLSGTE